MLYSLKKKHNYVLSYTPVSLVLHIECLYIFNVTASDLEANNILSDNSVVKMLDYGPKGCEFKPQHYQVLGTSKGP